MDSLSQTMLVLLVTLLVSGSCMGSRSIYQASSENEEPFLQQPVWKSPVTSNKCPMCIQFASSTINELLNIILNMGVIESCNKLCNALAQKTGSKAVGVVCTILCDVEGVEEFVKLVEKADLDPFYLCELLKVCPIFDHGDATITKLTITPKVGPQGKKTISLEYVSKNGTGTGEIVLMVKTVDGIPVDGAFIEQEQKAGTYQKTFSLEAARDPHCDPTTQICEEWLPGNYTLIIDICNGECGSKHPHSQRYDRKQTYFTLTRN